MFTLRTKATNLLKHSLEPQLLARKWCTGRFRPATHPNMASRLSCSYSKPCARCDAQLLRHLQEHTPEMEKDFWEYKVPVRFLCPRCTGGCASFLLSYCQDSGYFPCLAGMDTMEATIPLPFDLVSHLERVVHASSVGKGDVTFKPHASFVQHLRSMEHLPESYKSALLRWAPHALVSFSEEVQGTKRTWHKFSKAQSRSSSECDPSEIDASSFGGANELDVNGGLPFSSIDGTSYRKDLEKHAEEVGIPSGDFEDRFTPGEGEEMPPEAKETSIGAYQIGPDLIPVEVFADTDGNLQAGLEKRVLPLPYKARHSELEKRIRKTVDALCRHVFTAEKVRQFREDHPQLSELKSAKWTGARFEQRFLEQLCYPESKIKNTFAVKKNEVLPAKGKAPRPLIACGDVGQVEMLLPVSCIEHILFDFFDEASIKHMSKSDAMERVSKRFSSAPYTKKYHRKEKLHIVEGDGSAWDACCNSSIRNLIENKIIKEVSKHLKGDPEVPDSWFDAVIANMETKMLSGKNASFSTVLMEAIRQSGHRGTSCFNFLTNLVLWLAVLAEDPDTLVWKEHATGNLACLYRSVRDGKTYRLIYAFEGDDSLIGTTENLSEHRKAIEESWTSLGFRMKLLYVGVDKKFATFTGFNFLPSSHGLASGVYCPEIPRNIASSSFTSSPLVLNNPSKKHEVGAAAMLARADNFRMHGPMSNYFAQLGLAHIQQMGKDVALDPSQTKALGMGEEGMKSVFSALCELADTAEPRSKEMVMLDDAVIPNAISSDVEEMLLCCAFDDPCDTESARCLIPRMLWDPRQYSRPRRPPGL